MSIREINLLKGAAHSHNESNLLTYRMNVRSTLLSLNKLQTNLTY